MISNPQVDSADTATLKQEDLENYIPGYGNRVLVVTYAKQNSAAGTENTPGGALKDVLMDKSDQYSDPNVIMIPTRKMQRRRISIGWFHKN